MKNKEVIKILEDLEGNLSNPDLFSPGQIKFIEEFIEGAILKIKHDNHTQKK